MKKNDIRNEVVVARDGAEALDHLFGLRQLGLYWLVLDERPPRTRRA